jgi:uncharacterized protein
MGIVTRILLIAAIALLAFFWIRKMLRSGDGSEKKPSEPQSPEQMGEWPQDLIACNHCGLHLPRADARFKKGRAYCCEDHADADADADSNAKD